MNFGLVLLVVICRDPFSLPNQKHLGGGNSIFFQISTPGEMDPTWLQSTAIFFKKTGWWKTTQQKKHKKTAPRYSLHHSSNLEWQPEGVTSTQGWESERSSGHFFEGGVIFQSEGKMVGGKKTLGMGDPNKKSCFIFTPKPWGNGLVQPPTRYIVGIY